LPLRLYLSWSGQSGRRQRGQLGPGGSVSGLRSDGVATWRAAQLATTTGERCGDCGCLITTSAEAFRRQWLFGPPDVERLETDKLCYPEERSSCDDDCECAQRAQERQRLTSPKLRYRYDALVAIAGGISEHDAAEDVIRRAAPDAVGLKSLGKYLRTFWAAPIAVLPAYITICPTLPDLPSDLCEACNGTSSGMDRRWRPTPCMVCCGTGNRSVPVAADGDPTCGMKNECGGNCIRSPGHEGHHVCRGDYKHDDGTYIPGSCPA
jgi:hypothetical protein